MANGPSSESSLQNVLLATCPLLSEEHPHPPAQEHSHLLRPDTSAPFSTVPLPHTHGRLLLHRVLPTGPSRVLHVCHFSTSALSPPRSQPWSPLAQPAATAPSLACRLLHSSRPVFTQRQSGTFQMKTGPGLSCCHKPLPRPPTAPTTKPQRAPCRPSPKSGLCPNWNHHPPPPPLFSNRTDPLFSLPEKQRALPHLTAFASAVPSPRHPAPRPAPSPSPSSNDALFFSFVALATTWLLLFVDDYFLSYENKDHGCLAHREMPTC